MRPPHRAAGHQARPVFLDRSGLRRRRVVIVGAAVATTLVTGLVVLVVGFFGSSSGHVPGFPGADAPVGTSAPKPSTGVIGTPGPTQSGQPSLTQTAAPKPTSTSATSTLTPTPRRRSPSHPPHPSKTH